MTRNDLLARITEYFPDLDLNGHVATCAELEDGSPVVLVDGGSTMFSAHGADLHVTWPVPGGKVHCYAVEPDGRRYLGAGADDPFSALAASRN
jgi:hypothetical protein